MQRKLCKPDVFLDRLLQLRGVNLALKILLVVSNQLNIHRRHSHEYRHRVDTVGCQKLPDLTKANIICYTVDDVSAAEKQNKSTAPQTNFTLVHQKRFEFVEIARKRASE